MQFIKKIPLWGWVVIVVASLMFWQYLSGWALSGKLYSMVLDNLRKDQTSAVEQLSKELKISRTEKEKVKKEIIQIQKEKELWKQKSLQYEKENLRLKGEVDALEFKLHQVVVSSDPDALILDINKYLQQRGVGAIRKR